MGVDVEEEFPLTEEVAYLDNAATTLTPKSAGEEMQRYVETCGGNYGRGAHRLARKVTNRYEEVRKDVKILLGINGHLVFTKNSTEAINAASKGLPLDGNVVTTTLEHHSNLAPWMREADEVRLVDHDVGVLDPADFEDEVDDETSLVAVTHVSNVYGSIQPIEGIRDAARDHGALLLVDGAQAAGHLRVDVSGLGADLYAFSGHKGLLGPQGTGGLALTEEAAEQMDPLLLGGGAVHSVTETDYELEEAPNRFEAGTPNLPGIAGLGAAVDVLREYGIKRGERRARRQAKEAAAKLSELEEVEVYRNENSIGTVSFNLNEWNPHDVASMLDRIGDVCVRSGHHCAIQALEDVAPRGTVRASFALYNDEEDVQKLIETVKKILSLE